MAAISSLEDIPVTPALAREHGLSDEEYVLLVRTLGRAPTFTELGVVSVMWSEHCSYKSSKKLLKTLPTQGEAVVQGPGENAGAVSIGDGEAIVFKVESHNHPSAVEPFQGATTGVGGILRDIFTMGARPIAMLNSLRFGDPSNPKVKRLALEVVRGIADYGNCVGVPTVAGEVYFDKRYEGNPLVNAMCVGRIHTANLTKATARTVGAAVVYFGNPTGRDGVHGATFASVELTEETKAQRSAVQVGDPFMGKKILEATLDLIESGLIEAIQDMGAAGLTCSSCEMGGRGGLGVRVDLDKVPRRAEGLSAYELMLSESQERMLAVCSLENIPKVAELLGRWDLGAHVIGEITEGDELSVWHEGREVVRLPNSLLTDKAPLYDLPSARPAYLDSIPHAPLPEGMTGAELRRAAERLLGHPNIASKLWVYNQYDSQVQTQTAQGPGGGAAVLRLKNYESENGWRRTAPGPEKKVALSIDCNALFCYLDPREGTRMAVAEAARNLACVGARPLGTTNCLNFGNPRKPEIFWQLSEAIAGMGEACRALNAPVTGGNVSLYNENPEGAVFPTPVIGMVGLVEHPERETTPHFRKAGLELWLLGRRPTTLGGSHFAQLDAAAPVGPCPRIDLDFEVALQRFTLDAIAAGLVENAQDLSEGGLFVAAAEGALGGSTGVALAAPPAGASAALWLFAEDPSRILIAVEPARAAELTRLASGRGVPAERVGQTGGGDIRVEGLFEMGLERARGIYYNEP